MTYQPFTSADEEASSLIRGLAADMFSRADRETPSRMAGNRMEVGHALVEAADWLEARTQAVETLVDYQGNIIGHVNVSSTAGQPLPPEIWPGAAESWRYDHDPNCNVRLTNPPSPVEDCNCALRTESR